MLSQFSFDQKIDTVYKLKLSSFKKHNYNRYYKNDFKSISNEIRSKLKDMEYTSQGRRLRGRLKYCL